MPGIWRDLPPRARYAEISHWLILAAVLLFLAEVLQRRTGLLTLRKKPSMAARHERERPQGGRTRRAARPSRKRPAEKPADAVAEQPAPEPEATPEDTSHANTLAAMRRARKRARKRTDR